MQESHLAASLLVLEDLQLATVILVQVVAPAARKYPSEQSEHSAGLSAGATSQLAAVIAWQVESAVLRVYFKLQVLHLVAASAPSAAMAQLAMF